MEAPPKGRTLRRDFATGLVEQVFDWDLGGTVRLVDIDLRPPRTRATRSSRSARATRSRPRSRFHATSGMGRGELEHALGGDERDDLRRRGVPRDDDARGVPNARRAVFARTWTHRFPARHRGSNITPRATGSREPGSRPRPPGSRAAPAVRDRVEAQTLRRPLVVDPEPALVQLRERELGSPGPDRATSSPARRTTRKFEYQGLYAR